MTRTTNDAPLLIVPGLGGSGPDHWQSHWERSHPRATRVRQRDWDHPDLDAWLEQLSSAVYGSPNSILVAHSLGCVLVAHLARRHPLAPVAGALLVAPADIDFNEALPVALCDFAPTPLGRLPFPAIVVVSTNDPYMALPRAHHVAEAWGAQIVTLEDAGHINAASGYGPWPAGKLILQDLTNNIGRPSHGLGYDAPRKLAGGRR